MVTLMVLPVPFSRAVHAAAPSHHSAETQAMLQALRTPSLSTVAAVTGVTSPPGCQRTVSQPGGRSWRWQSRGMLVRGCLGSSTSTGTRMESLGSEASEEENGSAINIPRTVPSRRVTCRTLTGDDKPGSIPKEGVDIGGAAIINPGILPLHGADGEGKTPPCFTPPRVFSPRRGVVQVPVNPVQTAIRLLLVPVHVLAMVRDTTAQLRRLSREHPELPGALLDVSPLCRGGSCRRGAALRWIFCTSGFLTDCIKNYLGQKKT